MLQALTSQQTLWVDKTLHSLSLEAAVGQLLNISQFNDSREYWLGLMQRVPIGSARGRSETADESRNFNHELQQNSAIPLLIPANMEHGASETPGFGTDFPWPMGVGAADDDALVAIMGQAIATEALYMGFNWMFNPVVDLNYNFNNPITNIRSLGDDPAKVSHLAAIWLQAMQQHGVAATAKHFPGERLLQAFLGGLCLCSFCMAMPPPPAWSASDKTVVDLERGQPEAPSRYHRPRGVQRYRMDKTDVDLEIPSVQSPNGIAPAPVTPSPASTPGTLLPPTAPPASGR